MLVEPVLVSSHRETIPSHLAVIIDDSESMRFADPYTDETKANKLRRRAQAPVREWQVAPSNGSERCPGST